MSETKSEKTFAEKLKELGAAVDLKNIDFRVQSINNGKFATILAYKDARYDMEVLDRVIGPGNWQRKHESVGGVMYCSVGIWNPEINQWIWKQDAGTESMTEKQKGAASDSFKRACFNWSIGRELYDFPKIQFQVLEGEYTVESNNKLKATYSFQPNTWNWGMTRDPKNNEIIQLACKDTTGKVRFIWKHPDYETRKPVK